MVWVLPATFVGSMALGGLLGIAGMPLPLVEPGIAASVLVLGLVVATAAKITSTASVAMSALFALLHGHAHGAELADGSSATGYLLGFGVATAILHGIGIAGGLAAVRGPVKSWAPPVAHRVAGGTMGLAGLWMLLAPS